MSSNLRIQKSCLHCKRIFIARKITTKCCTDFCSKRFYKQRKRQEKLLEVNSQNIELVMELQTKQKTSVQEFLTIQEVCELLCASRWTIHRMIKTGKLVYVKVGRLVRVNRASIDKLLKVEVV